MIHCDWKHAPDERTDEHGWPVNVCQRCGYERYSPHHPDQWGGDKQLCPAWPRRWEVGCNLTILFGACGLYKPKTGKCGCTKREQSLNSLGHFLQQQVHRLVNWTRQHLPTINLTPRRSADADTDAVATPKG